MLRTPTSTRSAPNLALAAGAAAAAAALLAGCTAPTPAPSTTLTPSAAATSATPTQSSGEALSATDQIKVVAQADAFLRALVRPAASREAWWVGVQPYLTATAAKELKRLTPAAVGFTQVIGSGQLATHSGGDTTRTVTIPTDAGMYNVDVTDPTGTRLVSGYHPDTDAQPGAMATPPHSPDPSVRHDEATLRTFANRFMRAFAKPKAGVSTIQWRQRLASMLTDDAIDTYVDITPAAVSARRVTGPITVESPPALDDDDDGLRAVTVGTDAGIYRLLIKLPAADNPGRPLVMEIQEP